MTGVGAPHADVLITASDVTRVLPGVVPVTLVHDIDLSIGGNEFVAITGPSGSGKSSLLYLLGLLDLPTTERCAFAFGLRHTWTGGARQHPAIDAGLCLPCHFLLPEFSALEIVCI